VTGFVAFSLAAAGLLTGSLLGGKSLPTVAVAQTGGEA
jgi:hypothetical protein